MNKPSEHPSCRDCFFVKEIKPGQYECHIKAPVLAVEFEMSDFGYWPRVQENEWCGEFKRKDTSNK